MTSRDLLKGVGAFAAAQAPPSAAKPNIILIISDQFRWHCVGAAGLNPMNLTPNLDAMARHETFFRNAFCNQPVCAPARASIFTGQYPGHHGVWRNGIRLPENLTTLATTLRSAGYTANYIGKWHLADQSIAGPVPAPQRGGFLDLWKASNALEHTSHPYQGDMYDGDGHPIS
jgi:arylsulfatase A-like enzyme